MACVGQAKVDSATATPHQSHYSSDKYAQLILAQMNRMRILKDFCDVQLLVGGRQFSVHRLVLAASSPYFSALFTGGMREADKDIVQILGVEADVFEMLLEFIYSGVVNVTVDNVQELIVTADMLQLSEVVKICCEFLKVQMDPSNCVGIYQFLEQIACLDMMEFTENYIHVHFLETPSSTTPPMDITPPRLVKLMRRSTDRKSEFLKALKDERNGGVSACQSPSAQEETPSSTTPPMDITPPRLVKLMRRSTDRKSEFLKALKDERNGGVSACQSPSAQEEGESSTPEPKEYGEGNCHQNGLSLSLSDSDTDHLSSSLEAEHRLLKAMGWQEHPENDENCLPLTEDELKEFQAKTEQETDQCYLLVQCGARRGGTVPAHPSREITGRVPRTAGKQVETAGLPDPEEHS
ncbi:Actin-binding protein IPP [Acipenser ruthenus]|uniref:Actin-binding protein IPP n=1 Tax=Acipenser ruthenus TaxID=7906 RepID=A0A444UDW4_ACIRT|nr:Actin-binding protein IPP [Acipenser ruthenus]